jgi:CRISPR-associated protein Cmr4
MNAATAPNAQAAETPRKLYTLQRFLLFALDPVHVGAGGYRLGRVDLSIAREPGTNLPKIPGTSLAGVARSYAAMRYGKLDAAGQHRDLAKRLAADEKKKCPILYTFGTATDVGGGQAGTVSISDAQILFFPVHSMDGPVWVTTKEVLRAAGFEPPSGEPTDRDVLISLRDYQTGRQDKTINLGWLLCGVKNAVTVSPPGAAKASIGNVAEWNAVVDRIVLVAPKLFSQIVNSNLEVRTSVSIDPNTGAAAKGMLFTYEAIPRLAWLWCDVVEDDYPKLSGASFPETHKQYDGKNKKDNAGGGLGDIWRRPLEVVRAGLGLAEHLGVGGMGTRGFGRLRRVADWEVPDGKS